MSISLGEIGAALPTGWAVTRFIKSGGQGAVLEGTCNGRRVALKLFEPSTDRRRLDREVGLLSTLSCPFLVSVLNATTITLRGAQVPMITFEYIDGKDLRDAMIVSAIRPDLATLERIGVHVGTAIELLWQHRVVHRDVKPENIVEAADGRFVLVDLGLAQHLARSTITPPNAAPGTQGYRSPEQQRGRARLTIHSDIFSLGVTLFEVASGEHPWRRMEHVMAFNSPEQLATKRPDLPPAFCQAVHRMLSVQPALRSTSPAKLFRGTGAA